MSILVTGGAGTTGHGLVLVPAATHEGVDAPDNRNSQVRQQ